MGINRLSLQQSTLFLKGTAIYLKYASEEISFALSVENNKGEPVIEYLLHQNGGIFEIARFLPAARTISADGRITYGIVELRPDFATYREGLQEQDGRKHAPILLSQNQVDANGQGILARYPPHCRGYYYSHN